MLEKLPSRSFTPLFALTPLVTLLWNNGLMGDLYFGLRFLCRAEGKITFLRNGLTEKTSEDSEKIEGLAISSCLESSTFLFESSILSTFLSESSVLSMTYTSRFLIGV